MAAHVAANFYFFIPLLRGARVGPVRWRGVFADCALALMHWRANTPCPSQEGNPLRLFTF